MRCIRAVCSGVLLSSEPTGSFRLFALAALALHGSVAVALVKRAEPTDNDASDGAPAIYIGLVMTAQHADNGLPPGITAEDVAASQASPDAQASRRRRTCSRTSRPRPTTRPSGAGKSREKPEDTPKPQTLQTKASEQPVVRVAAAPPTSDTAQEAPRSVAPAHGKGDGARRVVTTWHRRLLAYLDRQALPKGSPHDATITVDFTIDRLGHGLAAHVAKASGDAAFDDAGLDMLHRADPVPPPPALVADESLSFSVPVVFTAKRR